MKQIWLLMTETSEEILISALPEKCTRQNVLIVVLKPKCLLNLTPKDRFTAESVFLTTGRPEKTADIKCNLYNLSLHQHLFLFYFFKIHIDSEYTF